jgi:hypothetical protein
VDTVEWDVLLFYLDAAAFYLRKRVKICFHDCCLADPNTGEPPPFLCNYSCLS